MKLKEFLQSYSPYDWVKPGEYKFGFGCVIERDGNILLPHPSHEKAVLRRYGLDKKSISSILSANESCNFREYLAKTTKVIFVYDKGYIGSCTKKQWQVMARLKQHGLYTGTLLEVGTFSVFDRQLAQRPKVYVNR